MPTKEDKADFADYVRGVTDKQVRGVYEKEHKANRRAYAQIAVEEGLRRGFDVRG